MKRMTNSQLVNGIINDSSYGSLAEVFVIQGILFYAEAVLRNTEPWTNGLIPEAAWKGIAQEAADKINNRK